MRDIFPAIALTGISALLAFFVTYLDLIPILTLILQCAVMILAYISLAALFKVEEFTYLLSTFKEMYLKK